MDMRDKKEHLFDTANSMHHTLIDQHVNIIISNRPQLRAVSINIKKQCLKQLEIGLHLINTSVISLSLPVPLVFGQKVKKKDLIIFYLVGECPANP